MLEKNAPKISILVPCYNVAPYVDECLRSIANQTLKDIEIICINDGSTDKTLEIIRRYADGDNRFVVIDKENEGYGKSMNRGLDAATGEYIAIVESDDWIEADAMETLYAAAIKHDADLVKADFVFFDNDTRLESPSWDIGLNPRLRDTVFCPAEQNPDIMWSGHPSIWTCLYRTKTIRDKNIRFAETPGAAFQDMGFKPKTFIAATRFIYIDKVILHYRKHANNSDKNNGKIFAVADAHDDTDAWMRQNCPNMPGAVKILNQCRFSNYMWNLSRLSGSARADFRRRFQSEFAVYKKQNALERAYFDTKTWLKLRSIISPRNPIWRVLRTLVVCAKPVYKIKIRNGQRIHCLFNTFVVKNTDLPGVNK